MLPRDGDDISDGPTQGRSVSDNAQSEDEGAPLGEEGGGRGEGKLKECDEVLLKVVVVRERKSSLRMGGRWVYIDDFHSEIQDATPIRLSTLLLACRSTYYKHTLSYRYILGYRSLAGSLT